MLWLIKGLGPGGAEHLLAAAAACRDRQHFEYAVAYLLPWKEALVPVMERHGVPVHCLGARGELDLRWARRLRRLLRSAPVDVLHAHSPYPAAIARVVVNTLPRGVRPRVVSTEHNVWGRQAFATRWANRVTFGLDRAHVAVALGVRDSMPARLRDRVEVVVHGVDTNAVRRHLVLREEVRAELDVPTGDVLVGTVANFRAQKGYPHLFAAAKQVLAASPTARFLAIGQGPLEQEIRGLHASMQFGDRFILLGYREDAVRLLAGCDLFALASVAEGLPVAIMEALALGLPVVATAVGGIPEAVSDGSEGLLVPASRPDELARALLTLIGDPGRRAAMAVRAAAKSREFDVAVATRRLEDIYREVVSADAAVAND